MALTGVDLESIFCSLCSDILKEPVTIPCGHSFCMSCLKAQWNGFISRVVNRCPQCKKIFKKKPALYKNTVLSGVVESMKQEETKAADHSYSGPQFVSCDVCTGTQRRADKSCLQCMASYCEKHLQPHHDVPPLQRHQLVEPIKSLHMDLCLQHNRAMEMFCRTDQQCICYICSVDQHKDHDITSSTAEVSRKKTELVVRQQEIFQRLQGKERQLKTLQQEAQSIRRSVNDMVLCSEDCFSQLFHLLEEMRYSVTQQISFLQLQEERRIQEVQELLEHDISELQITYTELDSLLDSQDPCVFLHNYPPVFRDTETPDISRVYKRSDSSFQRVSTLLSGLTSNLQLALKEGLNKIPSPQSQNNEQHTDSPPKPPKPPLKPPRRKLLLPNVEPQTREDFLRYWCEITLDPNTANTKLSLSEDNKRVTLMTEHQKYPVHSDRFSYWLQVLSTEGFTGRCYWEVEWSGDGGVFVAATYKNIRREGPSDECGLGHNDKSCALDCDRFGYGYSFSGVSSPVPGPVSSTIGVYLDHSAGLLSFYSVSETMTLLHTVQTTFSHPLHAGLTLWYPAATVAFVNPNRKLSYSTKPGPLIKREVRVSQVSAVF